MITDSLPIPNLRKNYLAARGAENNTDTQNRDKEEPTIMLLEWILRHALTLDKELKDLQYLFTDKSITHDSHG